MAGDWIKLRSNLWDDPRVARLVDLTDASNAAVVGALYWLWATADQHTEDGVLPGLSLKAIDRKSGVPGFGAALCAIGWLADKGDHVEILRFEEHNGQSAKRRCVDAQRKANVRGLSASDADNDRTDDGSHADEKRRPSELEKEKEKEIKTRSSATADAPGFDSFWTVYPNRKAKQDAVKAWRKLCPDETLQALILEAIAQQSQGEDWAKEGGRFVPHAATWLTGKRWLDEAPRPRLAYTNQVAL